MCLSTVELNLIWDKNLKAYVGRGFKKIKDSKLKNYSRIGRWTKASGDYDSKDGELHKAYKIDANDYESYHPGFHIFLNEEDAEGYAGGGEIYEVLYKNVVTFGTNKTYSSNGDATYGKCVVTEYMKIVQKVS